MQNPNLSPSDHYIENVTTHVFNLLKDTDSHNLKKIVADREWELKLCEPVLDLACGEDFTLSILEYVVEYLLGHLNCLDENSLDHVIVCCLGRFSS